MMTGFKELKNYLLPLFLLPAVALAVNTPTNFREFGVFAVTVLQNVIAILFASLALGLLYGVLLYFANSDNEQKREEIKSYLLWGVIGVVVVMGVWGILEVLHSSLFNGTVGIPTISPPS